MCFEFGSCFGNGRREGYGGEQSARKTPHGRGRRGNRGKGEYYSSAGDHNAQAPAYHNQLHGIGEAGHKAYHDGARQEHHAAASGHGGYAAYVQEKAEYHTPKLPAWHNKVGDDSGMDYHHYPTITANSTNLVSY